jgi:hypothetical protein
LQYSALLLVFFAANALVGITWVAVGALLLCTATIIAPSLMQDKRAAARV